MMPLYIGTPRNACDVELVRFESLFELVIAERFFVILGWSPTRKLRSITLMLVHCDIYESLTLVPAQIQSVEVIPCASISGGCSG